jgi:hypothetical protein
MSARFENRDQIINTIRRLGTESPRFRALLLRKISQHFLKLIAEFAPRETGEYAKSWKVIEQSDRKLILGTPMTTLFFVLEYGVDHEVTIYAKDPDHPLHWIDHFGNDAFATKVTLPPRPPHPHARTAYNDTMRDLFILAKQALMEQYSFIH